nr:HNH endonuclease [Pseudomonas caspiana]
MRKIDCPTIQDSIILGMLDDSSSEAAKKIIPYYDAIVSRYSTYERSFGNPWQVLPDSGFDTIKTELKYLYTSPPIALDFISELRSSIKGACPVCGRDALGTLDHYLPKSIYAEFAFYSKNLLPCCDRCNNKRNDTVRGDLAGERPIHPYYDDFAVNRLLTVRFEPDWRAPKLTPIPFGVQGDELAVVSWHIKNVIRPAGIDEYLIDQWDAMINDLRSIFPDISTYDNLKIAVERYELYEKAQTRSFNSWRSAYFHGLSRNNEALSYILHLLN